MESTQKVKTSDSRAAKALLLVTIATGLAILFSGALMIGISWDERLHLEMAGNWKKYGTYQRINAEGFAYGPVATLYGHVVTVLLGAESLGQASFLAEAYAARHISVAILASVGALTVGTIVFLVSRSLNAGLLGAAFLLTIPLWVGHGMFNPKDIAVATGYTLITAGVVGILLPGPSTGKIQKLFGALGLIAGIGLSAGTRTILILVALGTVLLGGILFWMVHRDMRALRTYFLTSTLALLIGYLLLALIYPAVFLSPTNLISALSTSSAYPWTGETLLAGKVFEATEAPWYYAPLWFAAQIPIFVQVGFWIGVATVGLIAFGARQVPSELNRKKVLVGAIMLLSQTFVLPSAAIFLDSTLYDGVRHFLFALPGVAGVSAIGVWLFLKNVRQRLPRTLLTGAATLGLGATILAQLQLFPYSYTYFNPIATVIGIDDKWPTDYWRTSGRELIPKIPARSLIACSEWIPGTVPETCDRQHQFAPYWDRLGTGAKSFLDGGDSNYMLVQTNRGNASPPDNCKLLDSVTRSPWGFSQTMSWVAECPIPSEGER